MLKNFYLGNKKILQIKFLFLFFLLTTPVNAHTYTGMIGFYDGLSHPVLGIDHFLAMVSVGIISAQIGGRSILIIPSTFVGMMIVGGLIGIFAEINFFLSQVYISMFVEYGIILSVISLGLIIALEKKFSLKISIIFISFFGLCHGSAHGMEMPWATNPLLFVTGFTFGTAILHLFGVGIGIFSIKTKFTSLLLRISGIGCVVFGLYLFY